MSTYVIVGVTSGQPDAVVLAAASFAVQFHAELICTTVEPGRYVVDEFADGSIVSLPVDPDLLDLDEKSFPVALRTHLATLLDGRNLEWSTRAVAGDPARALAHLADTLSAAMIVVGTRERGVRASVQEFFGGSVAVHLAHRQHRPVVVIPLAPVAFRDELPWESTD
ncbi:MAG: universal stress protein [Cryobacterium sp.]|uniref:universal stress protein n=1 Tax=unclassified Cryobacterium TaxID=2649013 RepID=UPI0018CA2EF8|nr:MULTISPECIES: universal stress protein [unclassified Cryobacterium]MCY7405555.1 universal stress protein [Cryobacterium sp.]MEC5154460.1 nucleotide-binding universal stress UspA family protein [Cryobacterium sp. CAN_C3]